MRRKKLISCLILIGIVFALPCSIYLVRNIGNLAEYTGEFTYMIGIDHKSMSAIGAVVFAWSVLLMFVIYLKLIKHSEQFENIRDILISAAVVGLTFILVLPNTSADVFFYMGNGRAIDKYHVNPYTTPVAEIEDLDTTDSLLKVVGSQKGYVFVYGPVFLTICGLLNKISFSSVALFLYEFKILNLVAYLATAYLIYGLTNKKKLAVCFAFNPMVLLEVLVNVHNDIFVVLFALLGIWYVKESNKVEQNSARETIKAELLFIYGLAFFVVSACIKYITILFVPFLILYQVRNERWGKKIFYGLLYLTVFLTLFFAMYVPYYGDNPLQIFSGIAEQSGKLKDSIYMFTAMVTEQDQKIVSIAYSIGFFVLAYIFIIEVLMQAFRKNTFHLGMERVYSVLLALIFIGLTNLTSWYLLWLFIPVFWTKGKTLKNFIWIGFLYELTYTMFYVVHEDITNLQVWILPWIGLGMVVRQILLNLKYEK